MIIFAVYGVTCVAIDISVPHLCRHIINILYISLREYRLYNLKSNIKLE